VASRRDIRNLPPQFRGGHRAHGCFFRSESVCHCACLALGNGPFKAVIQNEPCPPERGNEWLMVFPANKEAKSHAAAHGVRAPRQAGTIVRPDEPLSPSNCGAPVGNASGTWPRATLAGPIGVSSNGRLFSDGARALSKRNLGGAALDENFVCKLRPWEGAGPAQTTASDTLSYS